MSGQVPRDVTRLIVVDGVLLALLAAAGFGMTTPFQEPRFLIAAVVVLAVYLALARGFSRGSPTAWSVYPFVLVLTLVSLGGMLLLMMLGMGMSSGSIPGRQTMLLFAGIALLIGQIWLATRIGRSGDPEPVVENPDTRARVMSNLKIAGGIFLLLMLINYLF